jgi:plastocyanin
MPRHLRGMSDARALAILITGTLIVVAISVDLTSLTSGKQTTTTITASFVTTSTNSAPSVNDPWTPASPMNVARSFSAVATLKNGSVLVAGGFAGAVANSSISSAEMYNPNTDTWRMVAPMHVGRAGALAVTLNNGEVLVTGGLGNSGVLTSCELYTPATNTWTATGSMSHPRFDHQIVLLNDGRVLVVGGGFGGTENNVTETYDPTTGTWTTVAPQPIERADMIAVKLPTGNVLVAGGHTKEAPTLLSEIFNTKTNEWIQTGSLNTPQNDAGGVLLNDGNVLIAGGYTVYNDSDRSIQYLYTSQIFNTTTNTWKMTGDLNIPRGESGLNIVLLKDGRVLIPGGNYQPETGLPSTELYNPTTGKWSLAGTMSVPRGSGAMSVLLANARVLAFGGLLPHTCTYCGSGTSGKDLATASADLFDPNAIAITATSSTTTTSPGGAGLGVQVTMPSGVGTSQSLNFRPENITVVVGVNNTVTWTNGDTAAHTVTSKSVPTGAASFNSGNMNAGAVFTYTFTVPGTYTYYCEYHSWMQGTITVISK